MIYSDFDLSPTETAQFVASERERKRFITLAELRERLGAQTRSTAHLQLRRELRAVVRTVAPPFDLDAMLGRFNELGLFPRR